MEDVEIQTLEVQPRPQSLLTEGTLSEGTVVGLPTVPCFIHLLTPHPLAYSTRLKSWKLVLIELDPLLCSKFVPNQAVFLF